jgi:hypothetical protein
MLEAILSPPFVCNEWGALLLHQEALSLVRMFDEAGSEAVRGKGGGDHKVKNSGAGPGMGSSSSVLSPMSVTEAFSPLMWALKVCVCLCSCISV